MKALITGITGQDGSYLAELLLKKGYEVYGLVRRHVLPNTENIEHILDKIELVEGDMLDLSSLVRAVDNDLDEVYNLAAQSFVATSWKQPLFTVDVDALGVLRLLEAVRIVDDNIRLYQASSSEMYGTTPYCPQNEDTPFFPNSPYSAAKVFSYYITKVYRESYGIHASNGILFNHESPRRGIEFVTRKISDGVAKIRLGLEDSIALGTLDAKRDWGYAGDEVEAMWMMLQQDKPSDYVIATGKSHSVKDFVKEAFNVVNIRDWENYIVIDKKFVRPVDINELRGDASKAKRVLKWKPRVGFRQLVKMMVDSDLERLEKR